MIDPTAEDRTKARLMDIVRSILRETGDLLFVGSRSIVLRHLRELEVELEAYTSLSHACRHELDSALSLAGRLAELLTEARPHIGSEYERSWPDDPTFNALLSRADALLASPAVLSLLSPVTPPR